MSTTTLILPGDRMTVNSHQYTYHCWYAACATCQAPANFLLVQDLPIPEVWFCDVHTQEGHAPCDTCHTAHAADSCPAARSVTRYSISQLLSIRDDMRVPRP